MGSVPGDVEAELLLERHRQARPASVRVAQPLMGTFLAAEQALEEADRLLILEAIFSSRTAGRSLVRISKASKVEATAGWPVELPDESFAEGVRSKAMKDPVAHSRSGFRAPS
jgi:hypothetical protein